VLYVRGRLQIPLSDEVRDRADALLSRGERDIVLDLAELCGLDAAGIGELVSVYNMTSAAGGSFRIARAQPRVRRTLDAVGLLGLLEDAHVDQRG
jgi:anti-sigma B factor antagonist